MSNSFLIDKAFSRKYEEYFGARLSKKRGSTILLNDGKHDDFGVDLYEVQTGAKIDVKCYRRPRLINSFTGVFIETLLPLSGRPGWYNDDSKKTTGYIFVIDADEWEVKYKKAYIISKEMLGCAIRAAEKDGALVEKETRSGCGFILPYDYLRYWGCEL